MMCGVKMAEENQQNKPNQTNRSYYQSNQQNRGDFNPLDPIRTPWKTAGYALIWITIIGPVAVAFFLGVYNPKDIFGVIGIAGRRATGAALEESKSVGESLCSQRYGEANCQKDSFKLPASTVNEQVELPADNRNGR